MQGCQPGGLDGQMGRRRFAIGLERSTPGIAFRQCTRIPALDAALLLPPSGSRVCLQVEDGNQPARPAVSCFYCCTQQWLLCAITCATITLQGTFPVFRT